ncbi:MAG: pyruvate kinase [Gemmataceae bacterium]
MSRRTKIVATIGPATDSPEQLEAILRAGVDVARINFSHGNAEEHLARVARFREAAGRVGKFAGVLADLPGPKLRVKMPAARELTFGDTVAFSLSHEARHAEDLVLTEPEVLAEVQPGQRMLLDDGRLQLEAVSKSDGVLKARVVVGGTLKPNKGLNLPDTPLSIASLTDRDHEAIGIAARAGVDWVALSFVRGPEAADEVRTACAAAGLQAPVLAKIERPEAVRRAAAIIAAFDAIMVARGDLGVELPLERVPTVQKMLIAEARAAGKTVITATDMLDSMRENPRPTRAEASDVANAIFDGTDAVMLSGETAVGKYPVDAVTCMHRIAVETETHLQASGSGGGSGFFSPGGGIDDPVTLAACGLASEIGAAAIITPTIRAAAQLVVRHRPGRGWSRSHRRMRPCGVALVWGVAGVRMSPTPTGWGSPRGRGSGCITGGGRGCQRLAVVIGMHPIEGGERFPTPQVVRVGADWRGEP